MAAGNSRIWFFTIHSVTHLLLYIVPETLYNLLFRWPICALEWMIGVKELTLAPRKERLIHAVGSRNDRTNYDTFNLTPCMYYEDPMYSGHVHTSLGALRPHVGVAYRRETLSAVDGNPLCVDCLTPAAGNVGAKALVLILPGLTSSSRAAYVQHMASELCHKGYHVAVLNARGVGNTPLEKPQIFSALYTADVRHVIKTLFNPAELRKRLQSDQPRPLFVVGFSLGGVILCKHLGEQGAKKENSHITAAFALTTPFDLNSSDECMSHSHYRGALLKGLCSYGRRHKAILAQLPGVDGEKVFGGPHPLIDQISSIVEFDRCITAPHFGFNSPEEYYRAADCFVSLETTQTPIMCVTARDDPICGRPPNIRRWEKLANRNPNVVYVEMPSGGHLGFLGNPVAELRQLPNAGERLVLQGIEGFCKKLGGN